MKPHLMAQITRKQFSKNENNKKQPERKKTMKNTNFKTKLIARIMLLVLLLASALNLGACGKVSQISKGQYYEIGISRYHGASLMVVSDTNEYALDSISLQVYIGLHKKSYSLMDWITTDKNELLTKTYEISEIPDIDSYKNCYYILYVTNSHDYISNTDDNVLNYAYILKEISFEESLKDGAYNFTKMPFSSDYYYNHSETITIPKECVLAAINDERHDINIGIAYAEKTEDGDVRYGTPSEVDRAGVAFRCYSKEDGTVVLDMSKMK